MKISALLRKTEIDRKPLKKFLKKLDTKVPVDFQKMIAEEDQKVWNQTHCLSCANCCKKMTPTFTAADIKRIASYLNMTPGSFKKKWTYVDDNKDVINTSTPCQFLNKDNTCNIYDVRPVDCAEFPHHHKQPFDQYNDTFTNNIEYCPATYDLVNRLKKRVEKEYEW